MPTDPANELSDPQRRRHELLSSLTVICAQTQLLQRQLARMDGFADGDRARLVKGLAAILTAARALTTRARQVPGIGQDREAS
jgi:uncharacterized Rossmann fold enzyme